MSESVQVQPRYRAVSSYQTRTTVFSRSGPEPSFWKNGESTAALVHTGSLKSPSTVTGPCSFGTRMRLGMGRDFRSTDSSAAAVEKKVARQHTVRRMTRKAGCLCWNADGNENFVGLPGDIIARC